jgi:tetratricopeptide (TPR) repeat protein
MRVAFLAASVALAALTAGTVYAAPKPQPDAGASRDAPTHASAPAQADAGKPADAHAPATASQSTAAADASFTPAAAFVATAPAHADPARTYEHSSDAILAGDLDYLVRHAHTELATGDQTPIWPVLAFSNAFASNDLREARSVLERSPGGKAGALGDLLEPFLLAAEGQVDQGVARAQRANGDMPAPLPDVQRALVLEGAGRLQDAAAIYADMETRIDPTPPGEGEPASMEEFQRSLAATRITHALYRAALVQHRLGHAQDARRLYGLVSGFAPHSADVERNLGRLAHNQPPFEPALTEQSAAGRWMLFLADYISQSEGLAQVMATRGAPTQGLSSPTGALFAQIGVTLAPDAQDWRLYAAQQLMGAGPTGLDGAERIINLMPADSVFAPDAEIVKAAIQLQRHNDQAAFVDAQHAQQLGADRWSVIASAGDVYRSTGHTAEAVAAFDRALTMVSTPKDRASVLGFRAFAHQFGGQQAQATADMRAALQADPSDNTKELFVSIVMDDPAAWHEGVQVARELFSADPNSVSRLNSLGYALIQHPEGLEEGYRLLWRGFNFGQQDYAVVDSLGWAYYLYGQFDQARALCERARDLSANDPNPEILDHLGDIYWRLNRRDDARTSWRHALDARPDQPRHERLQGKLAHGLTTAAPAHREPPQVDLPTNPGQRSTT